MSEAQKTSKDNQWTSLNKNTLLEKEKENLLNQENVSKSELDNQWISTNKSE